MRQVAEVLRREIGRTVLLQGEDNKQRLLKEFVENGRAVLVATSSFWEGIDVRGLRSPVLSSTSCRLPAPMIRSLKREWMTASSEAAILSLISSCPRR